MKQILVLIVICMYSITLSVQYWEENQFVVIFCLKFFLFPTIFAFTSLCLRQASDDSCDSSSSCSTMIFVIQTINFCQFHGFLNSNTSSLTLDCMWRDANNSINPCQMVRQNIFPISMKYFCVLSCSFNKVICWRQWLNSLHTSSWLIGAIFQVRYTGYRDRPIHERQNKFLSAARDGSTEIVSTIFIILTIKIELKSPVTVALFTWLASRINCCNFCEKHSY